MQHHEEFIRSKWNLQQAIWQRVSKLCLTLNMHVQLQNDPSVSGFSEQLLDICKGKIQLCENTQYIRLPENFCKMVTTKDQ